VVDAGKARELESVAALSTFKDNTTELAPSNNVGEPLDPPPGISFNPTYDNTNGL